ncbi:hypothetical protein BTR23_15855 [Alkalihalophilus pseudofirmus]|nr:hypothetical protein BTR23_15855 [Alkalihalophilus pseudofirmus]
MEKSISVVVDRSKCMGTMSCMYTTKGLFQLSDGKAQVKDIESHTVESIIEAAEACPVSAITVKDEKSGKRLFP